jgi:stress-induced morphogen
MDQHEPTSHRHSHFSIHISSNTFLGHTEPHKKKPANSTLSTNSHTNHPFHFLLALFGISVSVKKKKEVNASSMHEAKLKP